MKATLNALERLDKVKLLKKKFLSNYVLARPTIKDWEHKNLEGLCSKTVPQMSKLPLYLKETGSGSSTWHNVGACGLCKRGNGELQLKDSNTYAWPYTTILVNESILQVKIKCITHFKKDSLHLETFTSNWEGRYWLHQIIESLLYQSIFARNSLLIQKIFIWEAPMYQVPLNTWDTWVKKTKGPWGAYTSDWQERDLTCFLQSQILTVLS